VGDAARRAEGAVTPFTDEQRLAFGRVAELYDRWRPSYPAAAIDAVLEYGGLTAGTPIVEVGAGTGKATELLAARGLAVLAIEPSAEMARLARARCAAHPEVEVVESEFEDWAPPARRQALVSAAAWHWIDPAVRFARAHAALVRGGMLAAVWSFPDWERCAAREPLRRAYRSAAPALSADFPMHRTASPAASPATGRPRSRPAACSRSRSSSPSPGAGATRVTSTSACCRPTRTTSCSGTAIAPNC
jgi:SAM-dependent methyltransferase